MKLDEIDRKIVKLLQCDGRMRMNKLAQEIHLSAPATAERVRRLEELKVITGYHAEVSNAAMGLQIFATILVTFRPGKKEECLAFLQDEEQVQEASATPGKTHAVLRVACPDMGQFSNLLDKLHLYAATDSYVHLNCYKNRDEGIMVAESDPAASELFGAE